MMLNSVLCCSMEICASTKGPQGDLVHVTEHHGNQPHTCRATGSGATLHSHSYTQRTHPWSAITWLTLRPVCFSGRFHMSKNPSLDLTLSFSPWCLSVGDWWFGGSLSVPMRWVVLRESGLQSGCCGMGQLLMVADKWAQWGVAPSSCTLIQSQQHRKKSADRLSIFKPFPWNVSNTHRH